MDAKRFDAIAKAWISVPRRRVVAGLATGAFSTVLGLGGWEAAAIACQDSGDCPGEQVCKNDTCVAKCGDPGTCSRGFPFGCQNSSNCYCAKKRGGGGFCIESVACLDLIGCRRHSDCPDGLVCTTGCCGDVPKFTCQPPCGSVTMASGQDDEASRRGDGTTMGGRPAH